MSQVLPHSRIFSSELSSQSCPPTGLYLCCFLSAQKNPKPVPSPALFQSLLCPCPHLTPCPFHSRSLISTTGSLTSLQPFFQLVLPHQQPPPVRPASTSAPVFPVVVLHSFCPDFFLPALCGLILQSAILTGPGRGGIVVWLLPKELGKLPAESTLASPLQCLVIRLVLGPVKAFHLLFSRIFLHSKPSPSCSGLVLSQLYSPQLGKGDSRRRR